MRGITLFAFWTVVVSAALAAPKASIAPELDVDALIKAFSVAFETIGISVNTGTTRLEEILTGTPELKEMKSLLESTTAVAKARVVVLLGEIASLEQQGVIDSSLTALGELDQLFVVSLGQLLDLSNSLSDEQFYPFFDVVMDMYFEIDEAIYPVLRILEPFVPGLVSQRLSSNIMNYHMILLKRQ